MEVMIVDDEPAARAALREYMSGERDILVTGEFGSGASALAEIRRRPPDVLFLDIQMDMMSGLQVARALSRRDKPPLIVFVTAHEEHAVEAFALNATDYLLKPFDAQRFAEMLRRLRHRLTAEQAADTRSNLTALIARVEKAGLAVTDTRPRLLADAGGRMKMVDVADVETIEADRNYITLRVGKESLRARTTLEQAEDAMRCLPLMRISRSCFVNLNHVREVSKTPRGDYILVLSGGTTVSSSEGYRKTVRSRLETLCLGLTPL